MGLFLDYPVFLLLQGHRGARLEAAEPHRPLGGTFLPELEWRVLTRDETKSGPSEKFLGRGAISFC